MLNFCSFTSFENLTFLSEVKVIPKGEYSVGLIANLLASLHLFIRSSLLALRGFTRTVNGALMF